jgi:hypothetical protein
MLLATLTGAPLLLLGLTWWFYRSEGASLVSWRRAVFVAALVSNAVSGAVLISFTIYALVVARGTRPVDLDRMYPVFTMLGLGVLAAMLAVSGRRVSRWVLIGDGLLTAVLWYLVGLAASP